MKRVREQEVCSKGAYISVVQPDEQGYVYAHGLDTDGEPTLVAAIPLEKKLIVYVQFDDAESITGVEEWARLLSVVECTDRIILSQPPGSEMHSLSVHADRSAPPLYGQSKSSRHRIIMATRVCRFPHSLYSRRADRAIQMLEAGLFEVSCQLHQGASLTIAGKEVSPFEQTCLDNRLFGHWGNCIGNHRVQARLQVGCIDLEWAPTTKVVHSFAYAAYGHRSASQIAGRMPQTGDVFTHTSVAMCLCPVGSRPADVAELTEFGQSPSSLGRMWQALSVCISVCPISRNIAALVRVTHPMGSACVSLSKVFAATRKVRTSSLCNQVLASRSVRFGAGAGGRRKLHVYCAVQPDSIESTDWGESLLVATALEFIAKQEASSREIDFLVNHGLQCDLTRLFESANRLGVCNTGLCRKDGSAECYIWGVATLDTHHAFSRNESNLAPSVGACSGRPLVHKISAKSGACSLDNIALHVVGVGKQGSFDHACYEHVLAYCHRDTMLMAMVERGALLVETALAIQDERYTYMSEIWGPSYRAGHSTLWRRTITMETASAGFVYHREKSMPHARNSRQGIVRTKPGLFVDVVEFDFKKAYPALALAYNIDPSTLANHLPSKSVCSIHDGDVEPLGEGGECRITHRQDFDIAYAKREGQGDPTAPIPRLFHRFLQTLRVCEEAADAAATQGDSTIAAIMQARKASLKVSTLSMIGVMASNEAPRQERVTAESIYAVMRGVLVKTIDYMTSHFAVCESCLCTHLWEGQACQLAPSQWCIDPQRGKPLEVVHILTDAVALALGPGDGDSLQATADWMSSSTNAALFKDLEPVCISADKVLSQLIHLGHPFTNSHFGIPWTDVCHEGVAEPHRWVRKGKAFNAKGQTCNTTGALGSPYWHAMLRAAMTAYALAPFDEDVEVAFQEIQRCIRQWMGDFALLGEEVDAVATTATCKKLAVQLNDAMMHASKGKCGLSQDKIKNVTELVAKVLGEQVCAK